MDRDNDLLQMSIADVLWSIGRLKQDGALPATWVDVANALNDLLPDTEPRVGETGWRRRYKKLRESGYEPNAKDMDTKELLAELGLEHTDGRCDNMIDMDHYRQIKSGFIEVAKQRVRVADERRGITRAIREQARDEALADIFREEIRKFNAEPKQPRKTTTTTVDKKRALLAMLSDVHYGIAFNSAAGSYNPDIARDRVMKYADEILHMGYETGAEDLYVCLMGDMISGNIHLGTQVENRENVIRQVIGVSELVAFFLKELSKYFTNVYVYSVSGNHSRLTPSPDDALRAEKLDAIVPWYAEAKLENIDNVVFYDNETDDTLACFEIFDINFACVHGDFDDSRMSPQRLEQLVRHRIDYMLSAHLHVPEMRLDMNGFIRNGCVCGSGDEFTMKKRLFGRPYQLCLVVNENGVEAIHPIALD